MMRSLFAGSEPRRVWRGFLAALSIVLAGAASGQVVDDFEVDQATISNNTTTKMGSSVSGAGILGSERDIAVTDNSPGGFPVTIDAMNGELAYRAFQTQSDAEVVWDGADGDALNLDPTGLGGLDLTDGGSADAFIVTVNEWSNTPNIVFRVYTDGANHSTFSLPFSGSINSPTVFTIPFSGFTTSAGTGADFTDVGAVEVNISATFDVVAFEEITTGLLAPVLSATKTDSLFDDVDDDGQVGPGDTVRYTVELVNSGLEDATGVTFTAAPDAVAPLAAGTVTTTQGSVVTGNTAGDDTIEVQVGTLAADGGAATVTFDVVVSSPLPANVTEISCQGTVASNELGDLLTDDPATVAAADPTVTPLAVPPPTIAATKTDSLVTDLDGDGLVGPGDTVRYTVQIANGGVVGAAGVTFSTTPGAASALVVGSVTTSQGTVVTGNTAGDMAVVVQVGTLDGGGGNATIEFDVVVADPLPDAATELICQGVVTGTGFTDVPTDDPATAAPGDPTVTPLAVPVPDALEIPTASTLGLLLLVALLAGIGAWRLRMLG